MIFKTLQLIDEIPMGYDPSHYTGQWVGRTQKENLLQ